MSIRTITLLGLLGLFVIPVYSQSLPTTVQLKTAYEKGTRAVKGKPGPNYWQNRTDYKIKIHFDPQTKLLKGEETISFQNNSPDALDKLIIRLYPDLYKKGIKRNTDIDSKDENEGVTIEHMEVGGEIIDFSNAKKARRFETNLAVYPAKAIASKSIETIKIKWNYKVNTGSHVRTGAVDESSFFIAYSFPRLSVYDDINGWDLWSYRGLQEFYNDFGDFDVELIAPRNYVVWATGELQNAPENLSQAVLNRLQSACLSNKTVHVIDSTDYKKNNVFATNASGSWKFKASNVPDFAFALSDHYLWDAGSVLVDSTTKRRTLVNTAYNKIHKDYFEVQDIANKSVELMSHVFPKVPFPYPQISIIDGADQMEYPMMVNDNSVDTRKEAVQLTAHEIFHTYFPFYMGINETQYAWMDEGWASLGESVLSELMGEPEDDGIHNRSRYEKFSGSDSEIPLIVNTKNYEGVAYFSNSYSKGALNINVLRDLLGDALFFKSLHQYMKDWNGKHPLPHDFFNSFNATSGKNLNWFWKSWFFDWTYPDLAIKEVKESKGQQLITIENKGGLPLPIQLTIQFENGKEISKRFTAEVWAKGNSEFTFSTKSDSKIKSIVMGDQYTPDKFRDNNKWTSEKAESSVSIKK